MSMQYIREHYHVPAKRGGKIRFTMHDGTKKNGVIVSAKGSHLRIKMDGDKQALIYHPTWNIEYL